MQKISNTMLSVGILALGVAGLMAMVWLSPSPAPQAVPAVTPAANAQEASESIPAAVAPGADPFAARMREAQSGVAASNAAGAAQPPAIPPGVDPFKAKLTEQSKQATASPFGAAPAAPARP